MKALVVEHDHLSRPERIGDHLERRGISLDPFIVVDDINDPEVSATFPSDGHDLVVLMGAPWSIYDPRLGGWLQPEFDLIRHHVARGTPILGICFGAQAVSAAMGGVVSETDRPEYGWGHISSQVEQIADGPWFQFHHDEFTLPQGAEGIASSESGLQAYKMGPNLCVQFHPEVTVDLISSWCAAGGADELIAHGIDPEAVIEDTRVKAGTSQPALEKLLDWWLDGLES